MLQSLRAGCELKLRNLHDGGQGRAADHGRHCGESAKKGGHPGAIILPQGTGSGIINFFGCRIRLSEKGGGRADYMDQQAIFQPATN